MISGQSEQRKPSACQIAYISLVSGIALQLNLLNRQCNKHLVSSCMSLEEFRHE
jgi:hypothetical protein